MPLSFLWEALGGLGLFILGMKSMSEGLQKLASERLRRILERITGNRLSAALTGGSLASLLQSSSAASILVIGFVNAGLLSLYQALAILLGTGIGTTIAIQLIAFKINVIALPLIFFGVLFKLFCRRRRMVYVGNLFLGAGLVFLGLQIMESGFVPVAQKAFFPGSEESLVSWRLPAVLLGALLAFILQSGSAAIGVVIALASSGLLSFETGYLMVIGEILGTSFIAAIATINGSLAARRTALIFLLICLSSICLVILFSSPFLSIVSLISPGDPHAIVNNASGLSRPNVARHLANAHTVFSALNIIIFLPLIGFFARSAHMILPGRESEADIESRSKYLDTRVINTPTIAMVQAKNELRRMATITCSMYEEVIEQFYLYDVKANLRIKQKEETLDVLQREISGFLVLLSQQSLTSEYSMKIPIMLHMVDNLEHIGDQNEAIIDCLVRKKEEKVVFSNEAMTELRAIAAKVAEIVHLSLELLDNKSDDLLPTARLIKDSVMDMEQSMRIKHVERMSTGNCTVMAGLVYGDIITSFNRISEYSYSIIKIRRELIQ